MPGSPHRTSADESARPTRLRSIQHNSATHTVPGTHFHQSQAARAMLRRCGGFDMLTRPATSDVKKQGPRVPQSLSTESAKPKSSEERSCPKIFAELTLRLKKLHAIRLSILALRKYERPTE